MVLGCTGTVNYNSKETRQGIISDVWTFWEEHQNLCNLPHASYIYLVNVKTMRKIFSNLVCFSESPSIINASIFFYQTELAKVENLICSEEFDENCTMSLWDLWNQVLSTYTSCKDFDQLETFHVYVLKNKCKTMVMGEAKKDFTALLSGGEGHNVCPLWSYFSRRSTFFAPFILWLRNKS